MSSPYFSHDENNNLPYGAPPQPLPSPASFEPFHDSNDSDSDSDSDAVIDGLDDIPLDNIPLNDHSHPHSPSHSPSLAPHSPSNFPLALPTPPTTWSRPKMLRFKRRLRTSGQGLASFGQGIASFSRWLWGKISRGSRRMYQTGLLPLAKLALQGILGIVLSLLALAVLFISIGLAVMMWQKIAMVARDQGDMNHKCALHTSMDSTPLRQVRIEWQETLFDGNFMQENIFRRNASAQIDQAWEDLGLNSNVAAIPYKDGLEMGLDDANVQRADKYGGGFLVNVEGMHHLHCLNILRQGLYYNYEHYQALGGGAFANDEPILRIHMTHCLDTLRQALMCNVDTGLLGQVWIPPTPDTPDGNPRAFPDFNTVHKCKNFNAVREWAVENQVPDRDQIPVDYVRPPLSEHVLARIP